MDAIQYKDTFKDMHLETHKSKVYLSFKIEAWKTVNDLKHGNKTTWLISSNHSSKIFSSFHIISSNPNANILLNSLSSLTQKTLRDSLHTWIQKQLMLVDLDDEQSKNMFQINSIIGKE